LWQKSDMIMEKDELWGRYGEARDV